MAVTAIVAAAISRWVFCRLRFLLAALTECLQLHGGRSEDEDDDSTGPHNVGSRVAAADIQHESELLRLFVELLRG